jgi:hypothetical protein
VTDHLSIGLPTSRAPDAQRHASGLSAGWSRSLEHALLHALREVVQSPASSESSREQGPPERDHDSHSARNEALAMASVERCGVAASAEPPPALALHPLQADEAARAGLAMLEADASRAGPRAERAEARTTHALLVSPPNMLIATRPGTGPVTRRAEHIATPPAPSPASSESPTQRHLHVTVMSGHVSVWLRDTELGTEDGHRIVASLTDELRREGHFLDRLVINGHPIYQQAHQGRLAHRDTEATLLAIA